MWLGMFSFFIGRSSRFFPTFSSSSPIILHHCIYDSSVYHNCILIKVYFEEIWNFIKQNRFSINFQNSPTFFSIKKGTGWEWLGKPLKVVLKVIRKAFECINTSHSLIHSRCHPVSWWKIEALMDAVSNVII